MNKLYIFLVLFFNLNFAAESLSLVNFSNEESTYFVFESLDNEEIKNGKYKEFLKKEYLAKYFENYGTGIFDEINSDEINKKGNNYEIFLVLDKNKENLLNIALLKKNYSEKKFYLQYIENNNKYNFKEMDNKERPGYKNIEKIIEFSLSKDIEKIKLMAMHEKLVEYYKKFGFINSEGSEIYLEIIFYKNN